MRAPKQCGHGGCPEWVAGSTYCAEHQRQCRRLAKPSPSSMQRRPNVVRKIRSAAVAEWVRVNGWVCPGFRRVSAEERGAR